MLRFLFPTIAVLLLFPEQYSLIHAEGVYSSIKNIEVIRHWPKRGSFTKVGELWMSRKDYNDDIEFLELRKKAYEMEADAIILLNRKSKGESLIMTEDKKVLVGIAIRYN